MSFFVWPVWPKHSDRRDEIAISAMASLPPKELLGAVRSQEMTHQLELAMERGELGVLSRETRDINVEFASMEQIESALRECWLWHDTYPETDDYALVSWLEAKCADEIMLRSLAKISGGVRPKCIGL